jgi:uncharacterized protein YoxC
MVARGSGHNGTLDEISQKIGELTAYTHEHRHGVNNLSAKFDALALDIVKRVEALDTKMTIRIDEVVTSLTARNEALAHRVESLERERERDRGMRGALDWVFKSPLIGWLVALIGFVVAIWARDKQL